MKIYFHPRFREQYAFDPAAEKGRLDPAHGALRETYTIGEPRPATREEILRVHSESHVKRIEGDGLLYETALLAAGSAIEAAENACRDEFAFALCRPPGHHASPGSCWGFCYFNNVAVAVRHLQAQGQVARALIVDFDLHYGDGTANTFQGDSSVIFRHYGDSSGRRYLQVMEEDLSGLTADIIAVSAGFDRGLDDWGGMLTTNDYRAMGSLLGTHARAHCSGRLFAVLEGGYNHQALAKNISAFLQGLEEEQ